VALIGCYYVNMQLNGLSNYSLCKHDIFCYKYFMSEKKMFATRISPAILKELKHLSIDAEKPIFDLTEEAIKDLLKKYKKNGKD